MAKIKLVVICSPTATGKTQLAVELALAMDAEIVSADSLQVYRYLDIGSAKPTSAQRAAIRHHLIDVVDPDEEYNAALYADQAGKVIEGLAGAGKNVFVVGGTGLYIRALLHGILATPPVDHDIRNFYKEVRDRHGRSYLFSLLKEKDPLAAAQINPNDWVRVIRALEVYEQSGQSIITLQREHAFAVSHYDVCKIGLEVERAELKRRIDARVKQMASDGLVDEVREILKRGYSQDLKPLQAMGYKQVLGFLAGRYDWPQTLELISRATWQYAKRQMTWFGADRSIVWFKPEQFEKIKQTVKEFHARLAD